MHKLGVSHQFLTPEGGIRSMYYYVFYLKRWATGGLSIHILVLTWADYSEYVLKPIYGSFLSPFGLGCVLSTCFLVVLQPFFFLSPYTHKPPSHPSGKPILFN